MKWALMYQGSRGCVGCGVCGWTTSCMMAAYLDLPPVPSPSSLLPSVSISHFYQQQFSLPESRQTKYPANFGPDIKGCHPTPWYLYLGDKESRGWLYFSCPSNLNITSGAMSHSHYRKGQFIVFSLNMSLHPYLSASAIVLGKSQGIKRCFPGDWGTSWPTQKLGILIWKQALAYSVS